MAVDIASGQGDIVAATTSVNVKTLDPTASYTIEHTGKDTSGSDSTVVVYVGLGGATPTASYAAGANKLVLASGVQKTVGPGVASIAFITASGTVAVNVDGGRAYR